MKSENFAGKPAKISPCQKGVEMVSIEKKNSLGMLDENAVRTVVDQIFYFKEL